MHNNPMSTPSGASGQANPNHATGNRETTKHATQALTTLGQPTVTRIEDTSVVMVSGSDSLRFLQGQLSCNMNQLSEQQSLRAALCNLKGRVIADMRVLQSDAGILLCTQAGMASIIISTLNKYRVFFKATLEDVTQRYSRFGISGQVAPLLLQTAGFQAPELAEQSVSLHEHHVTRLASSALFTEPRFECLIYNKTTSARLHEALIAGAVSDDDTAWQLADIRCGLAHIRPDQQELYTPQVLNYDLSGVIDFKKGCYTGQEVVARMFYRAEAKKRLYHVVLSTSEPEPVENVVNNVKIDGQQELLRVMSMTEAELVSGATSFY